MSLGVVAARRSRGEQQQITRDRILRSAGELFLVRGFDTISIDRIAAHAGYTHGAVSGNVTGGKTGVGAAV